MGNFREPVIKKGAEGPSVPLNFSEVLDLARFDLSHFSFEASKVLEVPAGGTAIAAYPIFSIPKNTYVFEVRAVIIDAFDADVDIGIGDGDDVDGYISWLLTEPATAKSVADQTAGAFAAGKFYDAQDTLDIDIAVTAATVGKIYVQVKYLELDRYFVRDLA